MTKWEKFACATFRHLRLHRTVTKLMSTFMQRQLGNYQMANRDFPLQE